MAAAWDDFSCEMPSNSDGAIPVYPPEHTPGYSHRLSQFKPNGNLPASLLISRVAANSAGF